MIELFRPEVDETAWSRVADVLGSKFIGQGPRVDEFEAKFQAKYHPDRHCVAVSSGTAALHLAYMLAGVKRDSRVITPNFTCTASNMPLLHLGSRIAFADIGPDLCIDPTSVFHLLANPAHAILAVHYGGNVADTATIKRVAPQVPLIEDAAQALGAPGVGDHGDYVCYSFQAIKHLTTGDGGMLVCKSAVEANVAKRLRWFGIDRKAKLENRWQGDIVEPGYKMQMTDISAAIGLANMLTIDERLAYRRKLLTMYVKLLKGTKVRVVGEAQILAGTHAAWSCTVVGDDMGRLQKRLAEKGVESNPVHYKNSQYSIFKDAELDTMHGMNAVDGRYLCLPLHCGISEEEVRYICDVLTMGW